MDVDPKLTVGRNSTWTINQFHLWSYEELAGACLSPVREAIFGQLPALEPLPPSQNLPSQNFQPQCQKVKVVALTQSPGLLLKAISWTKICWKAILWTLPPRRYCVPGKHRCKMLPSPLARYLHLTISAAFQIQANIYNYDAHVNLINGLRKAAKLDELREARQQMASVFPLTEGRLQRTGRPNS